MSALTDKHRSQQPGGRPWGKGAVARFPIRTPVKRVLLGHKKYSVYGLYTQSDYPVNKE